MKAGTRLHEVGIPSNRGLVCHGEDKSLKCTNCSSQDERSGGMKLGLTSNYILSFLKTLINISNVTSSAVLVLRIDYFEVETRLC